MATRLFLNMVTCEADAMQLGFRLGETVTIEGGDKRRDLPDGRVELAYGSRRLLAAKAADIQAIPVFLHDWDDDELLFISLTENLIREDLTPHEQAQTVGQMHETLGFSIREIARRTGKPKSWVEDRLE